MPKKYCKSFPCRLFAEKESAYCAEHRPPRAPKDVEPFYHSRRWQIFRDWYITKYPLCQVCQREGRIVRGVMVDHIVELKDGGDPTAEANAMSMCWKCHAIKTAKAAKNRQKPMGYDRLRSERET